MINIRFNFADGSFAEIQNTNVDINNVLNDLESEFINFPNQKICINTKNITYIKYEEVK